MKYTSKLDKKISMTDRQTQTFSFLELLLQLKSQGLSFGCSCIYW